MEEALKKFTEFAEDPAGKKSGIKDVFTTVMRTAIIYDDDENTNWHKMWKLLQVSFPRSNHQSSQQLPI